MALFAVVMFGFTFFLPDVQDNDPLGMAFFPRMLLILIFVLSVLLFARPLRRALASSGDGAAPKPVTEEGSDIHLGSVVMGVAATAVYGLCMPVVGYFWITPPFLAFLLWIGGLRRSLPIILITLGFMTFAFFVLYRSLGIPLTSM